MRLICRVSMSYERFFYQLDLERTSNLTKSYEANWSCLLQELKEGEQMVGELVELTGMGQASVSKHLKTMFDAGLLSRRKEGVKVF